MRTFLVCILALLVHDRLFAQLCKGSLGDPVVNITFGSGTNPGPPLPFNTTTYHYDLDDCPQDGVYTVRNSSTACFSSTWHTLAEDHTPNDVNGYFMLANASIDPGDFYVDTVKGLCGNTTYEFAAWILNILKSSACGGNGITPKLRFRIEAKDGTPIGGISTGDIPQTGSPQWNQYGFFFTTPLGVSDIVLRLTNDAPGGCGNDIAIDDITFRPCGPTVLALLNTGGTSLSFCENNNQPFVISAQVSAGYNNPAYQWQQSVDEGIHWTDITGATALTLGVPLPKTGHVLYRLAVAEAGNIGSPSCRTSSNIVSVAKNPLPNIKAAITGSQCDKDLVQLSANGGGTYAWTGPNGYTSTLANPSFPGALSSSGKYLVVVTSDSGCVQKDSVQLKINPVPVAVAGPDQAICEGTNAALQGSGGIKYNWSPSVGLSSPNIANPLASPSDSTLYILTVFDVNNCKSRDTVAINVWKKPRPNAGPDKKMLAGEMVVLNGSVTGTQVNYTWSPIFTLSNANTLSPTAKPTADQTYTLTATSALGCGSASDNVFVRVFEKLGVPNAFSPNGDGINDTWVIEALSTYPESVTEVFNRYGQLVFHANGYPRPWDGTFNGKPLPAGTYYYVIDLKNDFVPVKGWVFIVR